MKQTSKSAHDEPYLANTGALLHSKLKTAAKHPLHKCPHFKIVLLLLNTAGQAYTQERSSC